MAASELKHRSDIDGLRAVAVIAVLIYHAFPQYMPGGFAGVDVFFVISGYLIGGILLRGMAEGRFSFYDFYARRIRRIFPALILVLVCCLAAGWRFMLADEYKSLALQAVSGAAFFANVALWWQTGYFDADANLKPLLHLWSLGVEEQFYIVWPVILYAAHRLRWNVLVITLALAAVSFAANVHYLPQFPAATFFLPHSRIWEPLIGCLLAYMERHHPAATAPRLANIKSLAGVALIAIACVWLDSAGLYPGALALLPTIGAVLLISAGPNALINRWLLSNRLAVWIGLISYPLYLWHWPLLSFARIYETHAPSFETTLWLLAASAVLATLTYWLLELRVRHRPHFAVPATLAAAMVLVATQAYATYNSSGFPERTARFEKVEAAIGEWDYPTKDMTASTFEDRPVYSRAGGAKGTVLFIGDSTTEQYWPRVDELISDDPSHTKSAIFFTVGGCPPIPGVSEPKHPFCEGVTGKVSRYAATHPEIDTVVIGGYWVAYFYFLDSYQIASPSGRLVSTGSEPGRALAIASLSRMVDALQKSGKRVIVVLNAPAGGAFDPRNLVGRSVFGFKVIDGGMAEANTAYVKEGVRAQMLAALKGTGAQIIDPTDYLCENGVCPAWAGDEPMYRDSVHVRASYVRHHATFIDQTVASH